jgi:predicted membrane GTPase involved in stress response
MRFNLLELTIIRNRHPELVSGSMGYRKSEMLKKFQHGSDILRFPFLITDYGLICYLDE